MLTTFNIYGQYESSHAEQELFIRKLTDKKVSMQSFMIEGVDHDEVNWLAVSGDLATHNKATE